MSASEAEQQVAIWREYARQKRRQAEWLCREAGELLDLANDDDAQADAWQELVDERSRGLHNLGSTS